MLEGVVIRNILLKVENTVGKGEIARYEQFLLFLQRFQKTHINKGLYWRGLTVYNAIPTFNSLPNDTILHCTKLKAFADDKLNATKMIISFFGKGENALGGRRRKCRLPAFPLSATMFLKRLLSKGRL